MSLFESFHDAIGYLFQSYNQAQPYRLGHYDKETRTPQFTRKLLDSVGAPDRDQHNIKVTGSKGKGSTSRLIARLLEAQGLKVGLFTSPHLVDFTERIRINGAAIAEDEWLKWQVYLYPWIESIQGAMNPREYFGPVGLVACVAALYFKDQGTDVNVFELGRGARFDDVNQLAGEFAVITPIQLEHRELLGPELKDITWNKAAIIESGMKAAVTAKQGEIALAELEKEAERQAVRLYALERDFSLGKVEVRLDGTLLDLMTKRARYRQIEVPLLGRNQAENASVAIVAVEEWMGQALDERLVKSAFKCMTWPGRLQHLKRTPQVIIDGAINRDSAAYLREVVKLFPFIKKVLVVGVPVDKDGFGVICEMAPEVEEIWVTQAQNPHLVFDLRELENAAHELVPTNVCGDLADALRAAEVSAGDAGLVIVAGTQSLVAEALQYYQVSTRDLQIVNSDTSITEPPHS